MMRKVLMMLTAGIMLSFATQAQKVGHITIDQILTKMPEFTKAQTDLQAYGTSFSDQIKTMKTELETKYTAYINGAKNMTEAVKEVKEKELNSLNQRIQEYQQTASTKVQAKEQELLKPVLEKLKKAIADVAKQKGLDYVLEASTVHYGKEANDVSNLVKAKLGIK